MSLGTIVIRELSLRCIVGILPHERVHEQELRLDIELDRDFGQAARSQDIADTTDYAAVARLVTEFIRAQRFRLVEALAVHTGQLLLERFPDVQACRLTVHKTQALPDTGGVGVRYTVRREEQRGDG